MENKCEYCGGAYLPKRTDALYCSHTCRQLAYVLRKAQAGKGLNGVMDEEEAEKLSARTDTEVSAKTDNLSVNEQEKSTEVNDLSVKIDNLPVNTDKETSACDLKEGAKIRRLYAGTDGELPVRTDNSTINPEIKSNTGHAKQEEVYKKHSSPYLEELLELDNHSVIYWLTEFFSQRIPQAIWVSERYRCLLECLLAFSEMSEVETDDLKEACNAFTDLINSSHFTTLNPKYPYKEEILRTRERLRRVCIENDKCISLKFYLARELKQEMIMIRFELSQFIRKKPFAELNFKE